MTKEESAREVYALLQGIEEKGKLAFSWSDLVKMAKFMELPERELKLIRATNVVLRGKAGEREGGNHAIYRLQDVHEIFVAKRLKNLHPKYEWQDITHSLDRQRRFGTEKETLFTEEAGQRLINFISQEYLTKVLAK